MITVHPLFEENIICFVSFSIERTLFYTLLVLSIEQFE